MAEEFAMIQTIIITGFLGAGKTTLLNRLIDRYKDKRLVLLINEFGQVGIDGALLHPGNYNRIELNKGSLFCICVRTDFIDKVQRIADRLEPDLLLIEATGLADTSEMEKMLVLPNLNDRIDLHACLCLVDPQNFFKISRFLRAPVSQVRNADLIIMNKIDLVDRETMRLCTEEIRRIAPNIPILCASYADIPLETIDKIRRPHAELQEAPGEGRPDPVISVTLQAEGRFSRDSWRSLRDEIRPDVLRAKGFVTIEDIVYYVDATMDQWQEHPSASFDPGINRLVLIGQTLEEEKIREIFLNGLQ